MLLSPVSAEELRAGSILSAVTMAAVIGSRMFGRYATTVRLIFAALYIGALLAFIIWRCFSG